jgi:hypothetical protein
MSRQDRSHSKITVCVAAVLLAGPIEPLLWAQHLPWKTPVYLA